MTTTPDPTRMPGTVAVPAAEPPPPVCRCDADPEVFGVFAFAVLAFHRERRTCGGPSWCSCGRRWTACAYARLADDILFAAASDRGPAGPVATAASLDDPAVRDLPSHRRHVDGRTDQPLSAGLWTYGP